MGAELPFDRPTPFAPGQRLICPDCGAEIEIIRPCPVDPPDQQLECCGSPMVPVEGIPAELDSEDPTDRSRASGR